MKDSSHCSHGEGKSKRAWYRNPLLIVTLLSILLIGLSFVIPALAHFRHRFFDYLKMMGIPVSIGLVLGGIVDYYVPQSYISKHLAQKKKRTVFYAVGLGFLMSACSHGILALSMELHKKGASGPAVVTFLLASPWSSLPITLLLFGFFGLKALVIIFSAIGVAISTGLIFQVLDHRNFIEHNTHSVQVDPDFSIRKDIARRWKAYHFTSVNLIRDFQGIGKGVRALGQMILWWIVMGMLLASLTAAFIPEDLFNRYFGPSLTGLGITLLLAAVLEVCSEGTSPLAFEIYNRTGAFGNAFAFLMGGVVTDYTEIGLVWMNLGKKTALWMVLVTLPQVLILGWLFNRIFS